MYAVAIFVCEFRYGAPPLCCRTRPHAGSFTFKTFIVPCCSGLDVVALCYCGMVVAVAAYLVLMLGVWHYEHAQEYSVRGQCVCVESPALALFSQDKDYAHKWRIFSFQTRHDSRVRRRRGDALLQQRQQLVDAISTAETDAFMT